MNFEIEFLPVGEASKAGDSIVVKYESQPGYFTLIVIDGGSTESGQQTIEHIRRHYGENVKVAHAILTHCDLDHACGFREIIKELDVRNIWMHRPWLASGALPYFADKRFTAVGLSSRLRSDYALIAEIEGIAVKRGMNLLDPFAGAQIGPFTILSPLKGMYDLLVPQFDRGPEPDKTALEAQGWWIGKPPGLIAKLLGKAAAKADKWVYESWENERLKDGGVTSATNESSVVLYGDFGGHHRVLLTGDAGYVSLLQAKFTADRMGLPLQGFALVQIPHHGSRSNVGPTILNQIVGPVLPKDSVPSFDAYVSCPKDDETHPRKMVLNAFTRRGGRVHATQGFAKCYTFGYEFKSGYVAAAPTPFSNSVEDYD